MIIDNTRKTIPAITGRNSKNNAYLIRRKAPPAKSINILIMIALAEGLLKTESSGS